jgi:MFS family permease
VKVLLRNRAFLLLITGQALSTMGDRALIIAFGIWVKELTGSNAAAGGAFFFVAFPYLFAPFVGVIIDRFSRRRVFIVANLVMAFVLFLSLLVRDAGQIWLLYAIILCYGISGIIINPTQSALVTSIVDDSDLPDANGMLQTVADGVKLLAPLLGAGLFTLVGGHVIAMLDAATFLAAALCVWAIRVPAKKARPRATATAAEPERAPSVEKATESLRDEVLAGLRHVFGTPALRDMVIALGAALLVTGFTQTLFFAVVDDGLHRSTAFIGVLSSVQGAGAIAAGLSAGAATRRVGDLRVVMLGIVGIALSAVLLLGPYVATAVAGALVFGAGICWTTVGMITAVQRRTPADLQGRALTATMGMVSTPQTVSIALGAGLSLVVDYRLLLVVIAVFTAACALWLARRIAAERPEESPPLPETSPASGG